MCGGTDASQADAGHVDAGHVDAGQVDAGLASDGGILTADASSSLCAADAGPPPRYRCDGANLLQCDNGRLVSSTTCDTPERCEEFMSGDGLVTFARCFGPLEGPCDESELGAWCDGDRVVRCQDDEHGFPPFLQLTQDCAADYPGGTCAIRDGVPGCDVPSAEECDPATYFGACEPDGAGFDVCDVNIHRVLHEDCSTPFYPGSYCFDSAESRAARVRICLPASAVPVAEPPTTPERWLACVGDDVQARGQGYEYVRSCPEIYSGAGGLPIPQSCYELADGSVTCREAGLERCDPASNPPTCIDASTSRTCDGVAVERACVWTIEYSTVSTPCDVDSGLCPDLVGPGAGCDPSGQDFCVPAPGTTDLRYLARCDPASVPGALSGIPVAVERCADACVDELPEAHCR